MEAERTLIYIVAMTLVLLTSCLANTTVVRAGTASVGQVVIDGVPQQNVIRGSGERVTIQRELPPFERILISVAATVRVTSSDAPSAKLIGDDNLLSLVETRVEDGVLYVETQRSFTPRQPLIVELTTPTLTRLEQRASGDVEVRDVRGDQLALVLSGAGRLQGSGQVNKLEMDLTGSGEMSMQALRSEEAVARIAGAGNIHLHAQRSLHATITGAGNITYWGSPRVQQDIRGAGRITAENT